MSGKQSSFERGNDAGQQFRRELLLGRVAVVLEALPRHVDAEVLRALTCLLQEERRGVWSEREGLIIRRISEHRSRPIRELARAELERRVEGDHGWDAGAWRKAIVRRELAEAGNEEPKN